MYVSLSVIGGAIWPNDMESIHGSLRAGDTITIVGRRVPIQFSDHLLMITYTMEGPGGPRFFTRWADGPLLLRAAGWLLLPLLVSTLAAIELSARRAFPP